MDAPDKIVNSLIGRYATIRSGSHQVPKGQTLFVGENSTIVL